MNDVTQTLAVLSAMITPVVLILASGSLILTTSQRLSRTIERTRKLSDRMREMIKGSTAGETTGEELTFFFDQLSIASSRARLLQKAMTTLYITLFFFIATCISIAVVFITKSPFAWVPVILSLGGVGLLFYASVILIRESRIAIDAVQNETDQMLTFFKSQLPALQKRERQRWWRQIAHFLRKTKS